MTTLDDAVRAFLACKRIAVVGVSRDPQQAANAIYRKLRSTGHGVVAVNPRADVVEGDPSYPTLRDVPGQIDAVVVVTPAAAALDVVRQCHACGVSRVWLHRGIGTGSVSAEAVTYGREHGLAVIPRRLPDDVPGPRRPRAPLRPPGAGLAGEVADRGLNSPAGQPTASGARAHRRILLVISQLRTAPSPAP